MRENPASFPQKLAAIAILGVVVMAGVAALASPVVSAYQDRAQALERRAGFETRLSPAETTAAQYDPADLYATMPDEGAAAIALRTTLDRVAREAGLAVQSSRPLAAEKINASVNGAWVELTLVGDLEAFVGLLAAMDAEKPSLLVRKIDVTRGQGPRPDLFLQIRLEAGQAWRTGTGETP